MSDWTTDDWATPREIVQAFEDEFGAFDLDVCCRPETAKAWRYFTKADDGLSRHWKGRVWLNPPYSDPSPWVKKAHEETQANRAGLVVACLPASTDTGWFHDYVLGKADIRFRRGRIRFLGPDGKPKGSPKGGTIFAIYRAVSLQETE